MIKNNKSEFDWGSMVWWLDGKEDNTPDLSTAKMVINPNATSEEHYHNNCFEFILVNQGKIDVVIDGKPHRLGINDTLLIPPNSKHYIVNKTDQASDLTIVYSAAIRNYST